MKLQRKALPRSGEEVAPHAGAWIETGGASAGTQSLVVAPHAGAWIETLAASASRDYALVAPHAGAWIETLRQAFQVQKLLVAPHAGAWIETLSCLIFGKIAWSLPTRERGLKPVRRVW